MSWYCERLIGELSWRCNVLTVSTLTMWGERHDREYTADYLLSRGFAAQVNRPDGTNPYPTSGFVPLELDGKTYILIWGKRHVHEPEALANVLHGALPFPLAVPGMVDSTCTKK